MTSDVEAPRHRVAVIALTLAAAVCLLLTGMDAKTTAVLAGSLDFYGLKTVVLDGVLCLGFALTTVGLRRDRGWARVAAYLLAGAAGWRAIETVLDAVSAAVAGDFGYWRSSQLVTAGLLTLAGLLAALGAYTLARRPRYSAT